MADPAHSTAAPARPARPYTEFSATVDAHWLALEVQRRCGAVSLSERQREYLDGLTGLRNPASPRAGELKAKTDCPSCADCLAADRSSLVNQGLLH